MPAGKDSSDSSNNGGQRTTFRPPWVKESPNPLPVPATPWTLKNTRRDSNKETPTENPLAGVQLRKTSITQKEPQENGTNKENSFKLPQLKPVPPKDDTQKIQKDHKLPPIKLNSVADRQKNEPRRPSLNKQQTLTKDDEIDRAIPAARHALVREESMRRLSQTPAPPPMPPPPPPPPPPTLPDGFEKRQLSEQQKERIEQLKKSPKVRPDWTAMLKEIESNKKLNHVECNDRSQPLLPQTKATEHFVFESEKENVHNVLLKQIQGGIRLKKVKTNDRSKPILQGLRKFRRQMTIEEQIQKSVSMASISPEEIADEADEMDDIDKVRDDLQSTKQMLALELRNKEAQERENKRLLSRLQLLEAELNKERCRNKDTTDDKPSAANDKVIDSLKKEAEQARKTSEEAEKKFKEMGEQLDQTKLNLEDTKKQNQLLEKRIQELLTGKRQSISNGNNIINGQESDDEIINEQISDESDGEDTDEKREKRAQRELKQLRNKLRNYKNKEDNARKERIALREIIKKHQQAIKEEKKKFKSLQKEVDKISALMKDDDAAAADDDDDDDDEKDTDEDTEDEQEEEEEDDETTEESESEESDDDEDDGDSDSERSQSEPEDAPFDKKKSNITARANRHENILAALKKGNFLLKTNAERLQDDLNKQKEMTATLQEDLDSVLAELG